MRNSNKKKTPQKAKVLKYKKPTLKRLGNLRQVTFASL